MSAQHSDRGTTLQTLRQSGSLKALFPRVSGTDLQAVLVNTAGGITGGDKFSLNAEVEPYSRMTITTQTAERAYRALPNQTGVLKNRLTVANGARINWVPQETILFQGCALNRSLHVDMAQDASLLLVEPLVFGRLAMGEVLTNAHFNDRIEIHRAGRLAYLDRVQLHGNIAKQLARPHVANGAGAMASVVLVDKNAATHLHALRAILGTFGGASLIHDDILTLRLLAPDSYLLRQTLIPVLNLLTGDTLPRCWMT